MNLQDFQSHVDARFDRLETKLDPVIERVAEHGALIETQRGFNKIIITILLAVSGFFAAAFFGK